LASGVGNCFSSVEQSLRVMTTRCLMRQVTSLARRNAAIKCIGVESVDFDMPESGQYVSYMNDCRKRKMGKWKGGFRWLYLCLVGLGAGAAAVFIQTSLVWVMALKFWMQDALVASGQEVKANIADEDLHKIVNLRPYTNLGCFTVPEHTSAMRCYRLFRAMGLRHLPVLDDNHRVSGIITRQNLLVAQEDLEHKQHKHHAPDPETPLLHSESDMQQDLQLEA